MNQEVVVEETTPEPRIYRVQAVRETPPFPEVATPSETSQFIALIERAATNPNVDVEKLSRMLDMQERILDRNARTQFDEAMVSLQAELPEVEKRAKADKSMYAKFEHIIMAIKPVLMKYGFAVTHRTETTADTVKVTAILSHRGGHREETFLILPMDKSGSKNAIQSIGSSVEYGRRYTMNSLLGIATKDADADGGKQQKQSSEGFVTKAMIADLRKLIKQAGTTEQEFCAMARIPTISDLSASRYPAAVEKLKSMTQPQEQNQ